MSHLSEQNSSRFIDHSLEASSGKAPTIMSKIVKTQKHSTANSGLSFQLVVSGVYVRIC